MYKNLLLILLLFFYFNTLVKAEKITNKYNNSEILNWVENIPIYPKLQIDKKNTTEFDSVNGKILIVPFYIKNEDPTKIEDFYNDFFKASKWSRVYNSDNLSKWEKKSSQFAKRKFFIKKNSSLFWSLHFVVENF